MLIRDSLEQLLQGRDLEEAQAESVLETIAGGEVSDAQAGALLAALRAKGETAAEVRGFAKVMRRLAIEVPLPAGSRAADIVGTGGDGSGSLNLSTGSGILAAACGVPIIKHGNRSISSRSGSADVLEALGIPLPDTAARASELFGEHGFAFLFAPAFHPAMKAIGPVRAALGVRTVFNIMGPLMNPAKPPFHVIGAFSRDMAKLMAETLAGMPHERAFVVHGEPGWDEASPVGPFDLFDVHGGEVRHEVRDPVDCGVPRCDASELKGGDADFNAAAMLRALSGQETSAHADALVLGAGLMLEVTGTCDDLAAGVETARSVIASGAAVSLIDRLASGDGDPE